MATASGGCSDAPGLSSRATAALLAAVLATSGLLLQGIEAESCYWCGPAAEQVHRSRRPPLCRNPLDPAQTITCELTHPYCATVATTPPYAESRICMKHNKDACYPRFCNTTNTWRMTCTCQGNLCNGETDERVKEAFGKLAKHNVTMTTTKPPTTLTTLASTTGLKVTTEEGAKHEFHNAHEMNSLWTTSSESEAAERLPVASALQGGESGGGGGGGEDDEDASEGSGAALRSESPRPIDTERTTQLNKHKSTTIPVYEEPQKGNNAPIHTSLASLTAIAILVLT